MKYRGCNVHPHGRKKNRQCTKTFLEGKNTLTGENHYIMTHIQPQAPNVAYSCTLCLFPGTLIPSPLCLAPSVPSLQELTCNNITGGRERKKQKQLQSSQACSGLGCLPFTPHSLIYTSISHAHMYTSPLTTV